MNGGDVAAHKCPHGYRCGPSWRPLSCPACIAVVEVRAAVLEPPCVFCNTDEARERRREAFVAAGSGDCRVWMLEAGCAACRRGTSGPGDRALLAELRAGTGDVFAALRGAA